VIKQTNDRNSCRPLPALTLAQYAKIVEQQQTLREVRGFYKRKEKKQNNTKQNKTKQNKKKESDINTRNAGIFAFRAKKPKEDGKISRNVV
jgi:hypothetical protein